MLHKRIIMPLRYLHTLLKPTTSHNPRYICNRHQSCKPKSAAPQSRGQEDDYSECDVSLQWCYNCDFDSSASLTLRPHNTNELLWKSLSNFQSKENSPISLSEDGGVCALQAGSETRIEVRIYEDAQMVHLSAVVHIVTKMRYNSQLRQTACNQLQFFQDMPSRRDN